MTGLYIYSILVRDLDGSTIYIASCLVGSVGTMLVELAIDIDQLLHPDI